MKRRHTGVAVVILLAAWVPAAQAQSSPESGEFPKAVDALVAAIKKAKPKGVKVEVLETTPRALGWTSRVKTPRARELRLSAANGACWAFGLLPRRGAHKTLRDPPRGVTPSLVAVGDGLVVVGATPPEVALTLEARDAAGKLLDQAAAPFLAWAKGTPLEVADRPAGLREAKQVIKHLHYLEIVAAKDAKLDIKAVEGLGFDTVAMRRHPGWDWTVVVRRR